MATPNIQVILQGILSATNNLLSPPPFTSNFDFQNPTLNATVTFYDQFFQATSGGVAVTLPAVPSFLVAVQNLSATNNLTVTVTPNGGAASPITLGPNGVYVYFDPTKSGQGISALTLTGVLAIVPAAVMVGA